MTRLQREDRTVSAMIALFCRKNHTVHGLCSDCSALDAYARARLIACPYQEDKPVCIDCTVHCYRNDMRERIRSIMRFAGPRMIFSHPLLAVRHIIDRRTGRTRKDR